MELIELINYWYSADAVKLFAPKENETALEAATAMLLILDKAANSDYEARQLIDGLADGDVLPEHKTSGKTIVLDRTAVEKLVAHKKILCLFLAKALRLAASHDGSSSAFNWFEICGNAVRCMNEAGLNTYTSQTGRAIRDWFVIFRKRRKFPNALLEINRYGPPFLNAFPESIERMKKHGNGNLPKMTCDWMREWLLTEEIPRVVAAYNSDLDEEEIDLGLAMTQEEF